MQALEIGGRMSRAAFDDGRKDVFYRQQALRRDVLHETKLQYHIHEINVANIVRLGQKVEVSVKYDNNVCYHESIDAAIR